MSAKLLSIIGPPAVGKTTLAQLLCGDLGARVIHEDWDGNPYLAQSYVGAAGSRLPGQLYFLRSRARQLAAAAWPAEGLFVSDYGFCQDEIFARMHLGAEDYARYLQEAGKLAGEVHSPDALVHMEALPATLLGRIAQRGREFEKAIDAAFLDGLAAAYRQAAARATCPVLRLDCERNDYRDSFRRAGLVPALKQMLNIPK